MITITRWKTSKKNKKPLHQKSWRTQTTFSDFATAKSPFKCIYLYLWHESKGKSRKIKWESCRWHRNENKSKAARSEDREWQREWHPSHVRMKECCLYTTCCQLILLLFEISAPEQTSQGQTAAHSSIIKVSGLCCSNTCATITFYSLCVKRALKQAHTHCWMGNQNFNVTILKPVCHLVF